VTIVVVQVGALKIYVAAAVKALRKKERGDQNKLKLNLPPKWCISQFHPPLNANVLLGTLLLNLTRFCTKVKVQVL
jgi:hypothetical protein